MAIEAKAPGEPANMRGAHTITDYTPFRTSYRATSALYQRNNRNNIILCSSLSSLASLAGKVRRKKGFDN